MERIYSKEAPEAIGPYSQAIKVDKLLFVSGVMPIDPTTGQLVEADIVKQTTQVVKNVEAVLKEAGLNAGNVVKTTCFIADMKYFADFNKVYADYFVSKPARSCVAVKSLPKEALVEIEVIAYEE